MDEYHYTDDLEPTPRCPDCGERSQMDTDGDGLMTMSYEFCENCGTKDYGEPVRLFEEHILPRIRAEREPDPTPPDGGK